MKPQRWYEISNDRLHVYNTPYKKDATFYSETRIEDLGFYRRNFELRKVWEEPKLQI